MTTNVSRLSHQVGYKQVLSEKNTYFVRLQSEAQLSVLSPGERGGPATEASSVHCGSQASEKSSSHIYPRYEKVSRDHPSPGGHS